MRVKRRPPAARSVCEESERSRFRQERVTGSNVRLASGLGAY